MASGTGLEWYLRVYIPICRQQQAERERGGKEGKREGEGARESGPGLGFEKVKAHLSIASQNPTPHVNSPTWHWVGNSTADFSRGVTVQVHCVNPPLGCAYDIAETHMHCLFRLSPIPQDSSLCLHNTSNSPTFRKSVQSEISWSAPA